MTTVYEHFTDEQLEKARFDMTMTDHLGPEGLRDLQNVMNEQRKRREMVQMEEDDE